MMSEDEDRVKKARQAHREKIARYKYLFNPPRWSLQWWKNLVRNNYYKPLTVPLDLAERLSMGLFWWVWDQCLTRHFWIKRTVHPDAEVAALRLVRRNTSIPVPRVWFVWRPWRSRQFSWIIMDRVRGVMLQDVLASSSEIERESYADQLGAMLTELRSLKSPYGPMICSASGSQVMLRSLVSPQPRGPFPSEDEFNQAILKWLPPPRPSPSDLCHDIIHPIVFTHGDLAPYNVMVDGGRIVAIIDWETAGWFPASWEYIQTHISNFAERGIESRDIFRSYIPRMMPSYPKELEANRNYVGVEDPPPMIQKPIPSGWFS